MSQKFIVIKSTNSTEPHIIGVKNNHKEAYALMINDFVDFVENNNPSSYSKHDYGAKASDCDNGSSAYWTIESIETDVSEKRTPKPLPEKIIAVIRNYKGFCEKNYLFTEDDFKAFVGDAENPDDLAAKINSMKEGNTEEFAFCGNDTFSAWFIEDTSLIPLFLFGEYNDFALRMVIDNYDSAKSPLENIMDYENWYYIFEVEESSKEIVEALKSDSINNYHLYNKGGFIEHPYVDALKDILEDFKDEPDIYKEIQSTIKTYDSLS